MGPPAPVLSCTGSSPLCIALTAAPVALTMPPNDLIRGSPSAPPLPSNGEGDEFLTFVVDRSFIRQLVDQFGSTSAATEALKEESTAFEMPTSFARRIYLFILTSQTQGTEVPQPPKADSKVKRQPIAEVQIGRKEPHRAKNSPEIADLEDLEQRFPTVDKSVIDFVYSSEKRCVKNAVKHIEEIMKREKCSKHELDVVLERQRAHIEQTMLDQFSDIPQPEGDSKEAASSKPGSSAVPAADTAKASSSQTSGSSHASGRPVASGSSRATGSHPQGEADVQPSTSRANGRATGVPRRYFTVQLGIDSTIISPAEVKARRREYYVYRDKADIYRHQRDECAKRSREAFLRRKMAEVAEFAEKANENDQQYRIYSDMAMAILMARSDMHSEDGTLLDVSCFEADEAITVLDLFLDVHIRALVEADETEAMGVTIITGSRTDEEGRNSVRSAVIRRAEMCKHRWEELSTTEHRSGEAVRLFVTKDSTQSHDAPRWLNEKPYLCK